MMNCMRNQFSRSLSAAGLLVSLTTTAVSPMLLAAPVRAQEQPTVAKTETKSKDKKDKAKKTEKVSGKDQVSPNDTVAALAKRPLEPNEDPTLIGKRNINKGFDKWIGGSQEKEVQLGRMYSAEIEKELKLVDDPVITEYVNRVGQNIVNHSDAKVPFTIKVVDSDEVNAFALPGGYFYVNRGLVLAADNEAELAGVMSHEIGHVAARHVVENQGKQSLLNYGMIAGIIFGGGILAPILQNGGGFIQALIGSKYGRGAEVEADKLGVQYMYAAGYDPNAMATMFEKLAAMNKKKPSGFLKLFLTHPPSAERRDFSLALAARFPEREEYVISTSEFQRVKGHLLRLSNAKATTQGDIDETDGGRPTLKRRQPEAGDQTTAPTDADTDKQMEKERPQLKKSGEEPKPSPSPEK